MFCLLVSFPIQTLFPGWCTNKSYVIATSDLWLFIHASNLLSLYSPHRSPTLSCYSWNQTCISIALGFSVRCSTNWDICAAGTPLYCHTLLCKSTVSIGTVWLDFRLQQANIFHHTSDFFFFLSWISWKCEIRLCWKLAASMLRWYWQGLHAVCQIYDKTKRSRTVSTKYCHSAVHENWIPSHRLLSVLMMTESSQSSNIFQVHFPPMTLWLWETFSVNKTTELMILFNKLCLNLRLYSGLNCQSNILPELTM